MSEIQFPIPSVSYSYNPSDQFHVNIGLPFLFIYKPTDQLVDRSIVHADPHDPLQDEL